MPETNIWNFISFDKWAHLAVFGTMVLLSIVGFIKQNRFKYLRKNAILIAITFSAAYGVFMEFFQSLVPQRSFEYDDLAANLLGCLSGYFAFYFIYKF